MCKFVFGIATTQGQAERIVEQLQAEGFAAPEISVLMPDTDGTLVSLKRRRRQKALRPVRYRGEPPAARSGCWRELAP
jgi:hypothetical protein